MNKLADLFYSDVRAEMLRLFFGLHQRRLYQAEIKRLTRFAGRSVEEELEKMVRLELLITTKEATLRYYTANTANPIYPELRTIVLKTVGLRDVLAAALDSDRIACAFVFGSIARLTETAESDVDLMMITSLGRREITPLLRGVPEQIGREINFHAYPHEEFRAKLEEGDPFLTEVVAGPKLFVKGTKNELGAVAGREVADDT